MRVGEEVVKAETLISDQRSLERLPSHRYHSIVLEGAGEHALPDSWIETLLEWQLAWDERQGAVNPPGVLPP